MLDPMFYSDQLLVMTEGLVKEDSFTTVWDGWTHDTWYLTDEIGSGLVTQCGSGGHCTPCKTTWVPHLGTERTIRDMGVRLCGNKKRGTSWFPPDDGIGLFQIIPQAVRRLTPDTQEWASIGPGPIDRKGYLASERSGWGAELGVMPLRTLPVLPNVKVVHNIGPQF